MANVVPRPGHYSTRPRINYAIQNEMFPYDERDERRIQRIIDKEVGYINDHRNRHMLHHRLQFWYPHARDNDANLRITQYLEFLWGNFPVDGQIIPATARDVYYRNYTGFPTLGAIPEGGSLHYHVHHI